MSNTPSTQELNEQPQREQDSRELPCYPKRKVTVHMVYEIPTSMDNLDQGAALRDFLLESPDWAKGYVKDVKLISIG